MTDTDTGLPQPRQSGIVFLIPMKRMLKKAVKMISVMLLIALVFAAVLLLFLYFRPSVGKLPGRDVRAAFEENSEHYYNGQFHNEEETRTMTGEAAYPSSGRKKPMQPLPAQSRTFRMIRRTGIHMFPEETVRAGIDAGTGCLIPVHWGTFCICNHAWDDPISRVTAAAALAGLQIAAPEIGQEVNCADMASLTERWWENCR